MVLEWQSLTRILGVATTGLNTGRVGALDESSKSSFCFNSNFSSSFFFRNSPKFGNTCVRGKSS